MTKTTMPEPVAWLHEDLDHVITTADKNAAKSTFARYKHALITTTQAEAYADYRVREALGPVIDELERICAADRAGDCESISMDALSYIRALFPQ